VYGDVDEALLELNPLNMGFVVRGSVADRARSMSPIMS
jgi:hypothetical protein